MPARVVLFVGPSLAPSNVRELCSPEIDIRPPVMRGDVQALIGQVNAIYVVDGVFHQRLSVSVRELLEALRAGIAIAGSSSMGALRAAELDRHGMAGVGEVYQMFRRGETSSDADVALVFDPESYVALSEPVVNVLYAARCARAAGVLSADEAAELVAIARATHFPRRTYRALVRQAPPALAGAAGRLVEFVAANRAQVDLKRRDALDLIALANRNLGRSGSGEYT